MSITVTGIGDSVTAQAQADLKIVYVFKKCITEVNRTQTYNAKDLDVVMPIDNLFECRGNYRDTLERCHYF